MLVRDVDGQIGGHDGDRNIGGRKRVRDIGPLVEDEEAAAEEHEDVRFIYGPAGVQEGERDIGGEICIVQVIGAEQEIDRSYPYTSRSSNSCWTASRTSLITLECHMIEQSART